jgi:DNA-binding XRE family transcriptional regulator
MVVAIKKLQTTQRGTRAAFANWFSNELSERGLTVGVFARHIQVSESTVYQWNVGAQTPSVEACRRIAVAFGLDECVVRERVGRPSNVNRLKPANIIPITGRKITKPEPIRSEPEQNNTSAALFNVMAELKRHIASEAQNVSTFKRYAQAPGGEPFEATAREAEARWVALMFTNHLIKDELSKVGINL